MSEGGGFFRGTSADQDVRFANKEKKFLSQMKVPVEYATKVDMKKVQLEVIKPWISQQITKLLGFEDEVLIAYVFGLLEEKQFPDPKILHVNITGFLEQDASEFCRELWKLLISAQNSIGGIPPQFLAKKKNDILSRKVESDRIKAELAKRREEGQASADNIDEANDDMEIKEEVDKIKATEEVDKSIEELNKKYKNQGWDNDDDDKKVIEKDLVLVHVLGTERNQIIQEEDQVLKIEDDQIREIIEEDQGKDQEIEEMIEEIEDHFHEIVQEIQEEVVMIVEIEMIVVEEMTGKKRRRMILLKMTNHQKEDAIQMIKRDTEVVHLIEEVAKRKKQKVQKRKGMVKKKMEHVVNKN